MSVLTRRVMMASAGSAAFTPSSLSGLALWLKADAIALSVGAAVTYFSSGTTTQCVNGVGGWRGQSATNVFSNVTGPIQLKLVAADIAAGQVTLRLLVKASASFRTLYASTTEPFQVLAKNLG